MPTQVIMPQLGESVVEGTVTKWLKAEGQPVKEFEPLLEINTDKVDTEIPSPASGVLLKVLVPDGQTVRAGVILAVIGQPGDAVPDIAASAAPAPSAAKPSSSAPAVPPSMPAGPAPARADLGFISPVVAKLAFEYKVDLAQVRGTGAGGRITKKDVLAFVRQG